MCSLNRLIVRSYGPNNHHISTQREDSEPRVGRRSMKTPNKGTCFERTAFVPPAERHRAGESTTWSAEAVLNTLLKFMLLSFVVHLFFVALHHAGRRHF